MMPYHSAVRLHVHSMVNLVKLNYCGTVFGILRATTEKCIAARNCSTSGHVGKLPFYEQICLVVKFIKPVSLCSYRKKKIIRDGIGLGQLPVSVQQLLVAILHLLLVLSQL